MFRYRNRNSGQVIESDVQRWDLDGLARWERVSEAEVKPAKAEPAAVEPAAAEAEQPVVEAEQPVVEDKPAEAPKRRTRRKPAGTEVED